MLYWVVSYIGHGYRQSEGAAQAYDYAEKWIVSNNYDKENSLFVSDSGSCGGRALLCPDSR